MTSKVEYLLKEWGRWYEKNVDWADCLGSNTLYRAGILSGRVQEGSAGHKILCPDTSPKIRRVDLLVRRMTEPLQDAVILWYALPINQETGKPFTKRELAGFSGITERAFKDRLQRARKFLRKELTTG